MGSGLIGCDRRLDAAPAGRIGSCQFRRAGPPILWLRAADRAECSDDWQLPIGKGSSMRSDLIRRGRRPDAAPIWRIGSCQFVGQTFQTIDSVPWPMPNGLPVGSRQSANGSSMQPASLV